MQAGRGSPHLGLKAVSLLAYENELLLKLLLASVDAFPPAFVYARFLRVEALQSGR